jgi:hypothetical protein
MTKYQTSEYRSNFKLNRISEEKKDELTKMERLENIYVDPLVYGMKKFSDIDIATHSIMIDGLPKKIPRRELE